MIFSLVRMVFAYSVAYTYPDAIVVVSRHKNVPRLAIGGTEERVVQAGRMNF